MTEQQANALMELMEPIETNPFGFAKELAALTALCRHRDRVVYEALISKMWKLNSPNLQNRIDEMQTWEEV